MALSCVYIVFVLCVMCRLFKRSGIDGDGYRDPDNEEEAKLFRDLMAKSSLIRNNPSLLTRADECWSKVSVLCGKYLSSSPFEIGKV